MDINDQILKFLIEVVTLEENIRFMDIVRYVWEKGIDCKPQTIANILHFHCINHIRLSKEPYFYKIEQGLYRMVTEEERLNEKFFQINKQNTFKEDWSENKIGNDTENKQLIIAEFTKKLLHKKGFTLDHSDNTRIRFSNERLDSIVGLIGNGWSKQIKRLLLFEIENRNDKYTLKLIIGPGNQAVRETLYSKAKENITVYNYSRRELTNMFTTIYSNKFLNEDQLKKSTNEIKIIIETCLDDFINKDLNRLCEGLNGLNKVEIEQELIRVLTGLDNPEKVKETEKDVIIKARIGHGELKKELVKKYGYCKLCGLTDERFLIASHIKPWSQSDNTERLDLNNVLLLCPHHDSAFDKGYITFDEDGTLLVSNELSPQTKALLNLSIDKKCEFNLEQNEYIKWHRENIFRT